MSPRHSGRLDRTGVIASVSCAIHCMAAPIVVLLAPAIGGIWAHPGVHLAIASLVLPVAGLALRRGSLAHGRRWVLVGGFVGMAFVFVGTALPFLVHWSQGGGDGLLTACEHCCPTLVSDEATGRTSLNVPPATIVTFLGGALLVAAHVGNLRCCTGCREG